MQQRLESSRVVRILISIFVAITVGAIMIWNMPRSAIRREGMRFAEPYMTALGLDQNWSVFAPNPHQGKSSFFARVADADGNVHVWRVPEGDALIGAYWDFRWGKWTEWTIAGRSDLCEGSAIYAAEQVADTGVDPVLVTIVARGRTNFGPGERPSHGPWEQSTVCGVDLRIAR